MARDGFARCHAVTKLWEGGWSNHPADPGGKTMYGVTEAVFHAWLKSQGKAARAVRTIALAEAEAIYRGEYWAKAGCDTLAPGVDLAVYDAAVNSGVSRSRGWLLKAIGGSDADTVKRHCATRLSFVRALKTWKTFGKGWTRRIVDIEAKGVAWALSASGLGADAVRGKLLVEKKTAETQGKADASKGATGTAAGGGSALEVATQSDPVATWLLVAIAAAGVAVAIVFIRRAIINRQRSKAYAAEAAAQ